MLKNNKAKKNIFYCLVGFVGLSCIIGLIFTLINVGNVPSNQFQGQENHQKNAPPLNVEEIEDRLEPVEETQQNVVTVDNELCSEKCSSAIARLEENLTLDDDTIRRMGRYTKEIASYLQNNEGDRRYYLQMALTTNDYNKIGFLTSIFQHLPDEQKTEIADNFIASQNVELRVDGIELIVGDKVSDVVSANKLMDVFLTEDNPHVKSSILRHFKKVTHLQGEANLLDQFDSAINNEVDTSVKVELFKAKKELSEQPYHIIPTALEALRSSESEFQMAGIIAIDQVLGHESNYVENGADIDMNAIRNEIQTIRNLTPGDGVNKKRFDRLMREANDVYSRYFDD